ncbi:type VII secretion protein EssA [Bacillus sp. AFS018417]|uniref:type VII secretion protein EssA n=1 Tax=Bacillus TaxID=1386 RepID=UPI000BF71D1E|nr:type VII secretion protein EssA [Bacillus sp. AFS018417]PEZ08848.1 type VII secretion protein EssA [Bacillus sp. AFS018417]
MIKSRKVLVNLSLFLFLGSFAALPMRCAAESYLNDNGKMEFKVDRIEQTDQEKMNKGEQETELDKTQIELFNPEVEKEIAEKQKKEKKQMQELRESLFLNTKTNDDIKDTKESLFQKNYAVQMNSSETNNNQSTTGTPISTTMTVLLIGGILLICSGIYAIIRKTGV